MKIAVEMTREELIAEMHEWFPWLREPMPYQPRLKSKEEKEQDHAWAMWRADMQDTIEYHAERRLQGKE